MRPWQDGAGRLENDRRQGGSTVGEVHGHFETDTQVSERRLFPHRSILFWHRRLAVGLVIHRFRCGSNATLEQS